MKVNYRVFHHGLRWGHFPVFFNGLLNFYTIDDVFYLMKILILEFHEK